MLLLISTPSLALSQAISVHDCQGFLRSKNLVEADSFNDINVELSDSGLSDSRIILRNLETLEEFAANADTAGVSFSNVPPGNYMLLAEQGTAFITGVSVTSAGVTTGGLTLFGTTGGALAGIGAGVAIGVGVHDSTRGSNRTGAPPPVEPPPFVEEEACDCDPDAEPRPLSREEFFAAKQKYQKLTGISSGTNRPMQRGFERGLQLERLTMNWWTPDLSLSTEDHTNDNNTSVHSSSFSLTGHNSQNFILSTNNTSDGRGILKAQVNLLKIAESTSLNLVSAFSSPLEQNRFSNQRNSEIFHTRGLQFQHSFAGLHFSLANAVSVRTNLEDGLEESAHQSVFATKGKLLEDWYLTGFISRLEANTSRNERKVGAILEYVASPTAKLQFLASHGVLGHSFSNQEYSTDDTSLEVMWVGTFN